MVRYEKTISNLKEVKARSGQVIALATEGDEEIKEAADHVLYIPSAPEELLPILEIVQLQWHNLEDREQFFGCRRNVEHMVGCFLDFFVALGREGYDLARAGFYFFKVGNCLFITNHGERVFRITSCDDDYRQIFVDQRVGPVFHFARWITLGVDVRNFFQLQRAF